MEDPAFYVRGMPQAAERTDAQIVRDVLDGDTEAYRLLVRRYQDALYAHALRMLGDADEAAEVVQDALVQGYRKLASCRDRDRVGAWLFRIAANRCRDRLRARRRAPVALERLPELPSGEPGTDRGAVVAELRERVSAAMGRLTPEQREAFVLKHLEGRSYEEMAAVMDTSVASLKMRVHRAREALSTLLEEFR